MRRLGLAIVVCALAAWAGEVPRPAPPLEVATPGGGKISLASLRGKVVLLKFFLTDCGHCQRTTTSAIVPVYNEWRSRGLEVLGVALNPDAEKLLAGFADRFGARYSMGMGNAEMLLKFADMPMVGRVSVPHLFLIDRRGVIRFEHPASDHAFYNNDAVNLRAELDPLLKEPALPRKAPSRKRTPKS